MQLRSSTFLAGVNKHSFLSWLDFLHSAVCTQLFSEPVVLPDFENHSKNLKFPNTEIYTLKCLTICWGLMSQKELCRRQIPSLTQNALGLFDQWVCRECPFMLQQWGEAIANCLPIMSFSTKTSPALWKRGYGQTSEEWRAVFIF